MPSIFAFRPDQARRLIRQARWEFDAARCCDGEREYPGGHGLMVPRGIVELWRLQSVRNAREYREMARRAILDAWPYEWHLMRLAAEMAKLRLERIERRAAA